ncbi:MAG: hypothetical protein HC794_01465, partial [Nitrospiraceae bacterium]|nr:hypothetical protein [Nitrospiraceae bacterium]
MTLMPGSGAATTAGATTLLSTSTYPAHAQRPTTAIPRGAFGKLYDNGTPPGVNRSLSRDLLEVELLLHGSSSEKSVMAKYSSLMTRPTSPWFVSTTHAAAEPAQSFLLRSVADVIR